MKDELLVAMYRTLQDLIKENEELVSTFFENSIEEKKELVKVMEARINTFHELKDFYMRFKLDPSDEIEKEIYDNYRFILEDQLRRIRKERAKSTPEVAAKAPEKHDEVASVSHDVLENKEDSKESPSIPDLANNKDTVPISFPTINRITPPSIKKEETAEEKAAVEGDIPELRTISEWCDIYELDIVSPDGFNREDFSFDNIISEEEFTRCIKECTIRPRGMKL